MPNSKFKRTNNNFFKFTPPRIIVISFALIILFGTFLLKLPIATRSTGSATLLEALFTATSSTCITGLVIADTYTKWTTFGQIVILSLIEIGALGIVTLATFFSILLGKKLGIQGKLLAKESINYFSFQGIVKLIRQVVLITVSVELIGAIILSFRFVPLYGVKGIYLGVFHSISAFCNAGFDIFGNYDSLTKFQSDPIVLFTLSGLIVTGGLGFMVWKDIYDYKKTKALLLNTKVVLILVSTFIVIGTIFFFSFEFNNPNTMGHLSLFDKFTNSLFQSITCRTAGFNSIAIDSMQEVSKVGTIILMFIGAAPGSTGGGVKITTFGVIFMAVISHIRGSHQTIIFNRLVPYNTIIKALVILSLGIFVIIIATSNILALENGKSFIDILFEATSAFGTVGMSSVGTTNLGPFSKLLLIVTMFLGRVGPLSFAIALSIKNGYTEKQIYPEGKIVVG